MAERSWFFNAEQTGEDEYDRVYLAEDFAKYFSLFISNGVFPNPSTGLQVLAQEVPNMTVTLKPGFAFINGYGYENTSDYKFTIDTADGVLNREDSIFIRWYLTDRKIAAYKAVGTPGAEASHVDLIRTEDYWDLCVARIMVEAGVTSITQSAITDTRLNTDLCGIVATLVDQVDTTTLYNQIQADLEEFQNVSEEDFTAWYNQQQQMFTAWYQQQQQMFNTWYQQQQSDFDEWFDDINAKLGTEPATALQQQIDEINTSIEENSDRWFSTYHHVKNGTTHIFSGSGSNGKVKMTANVESGDTVEVSWMPQQEMTIEGETTQAGTGDPSPENIRQISGVGQYDRCIVLDGSEDEGWHASSGYSNTFETKAGFIIEHAAGNGRNDYKSSFYKSADGSYATLKNKEFFVWADNLSASTKIVCIKDSAFGAVKGLKAHLSAHPLIIWYRSVDYAKSTGPFYTVVKLSDDPYRAVGFELNQPLFDGDSLKVGGKSGFDQMVVLDGKDRDGITYTSSQLSASNSILISLQGDFPHAVKTYPNRSTDYGNSKYRQVSAGWADFKNYPKAIQFYDESIPRIGIRDVEVPNLSEFRAALAADPVIFFYKSVDYTEENDIPVALEKRVNGYAVFDGDDDYSYSWQTDGQYPRGRAGEIPNTITGTWDTSVITSHFVRKDVNFDTSANGAGVFNNYAYMRYSSEFSDLTTFKQFLSTQYSAGTPVQVVYELATPVTYAHLAQPESIPAYYGFEEFVDAIAGEDATGRWLTFTNDGEQLNFKGGGALSKSKLDLATADIYDVRQGMKFYSKSKEIKTGVVPRIDYNTDANGTESYNGKLRVTFDPGYYGRYAQAVPDPGVTFDAGNAAAGDVLTGKTFSNNSGAKIAGAMSERGAWNGTYSGSNVTIPEGHHSGGGSVTVSGGNRGAWSGTYSGSNVTIPQGYHSGGGSVGVAGGNRGNWGTTINQGGSVTIPQGYHAGGGVVRANSVTPGCERGGAAWANGFANGSGVQTSGYCGGGNNTYDAWITAAVSGYFCVWTMGAGSGQAPENYWFGWANAGQELGRRTSSSKGCVMATYIHI